MKKIKLTQGKYALVDNEDYEELNKHRWCAHKERYTFYALTNKKSLMRNMHSEIMKPIKGFQVDHINGNGLDNRRKNLRLCTKRENECNRRKKTDNKSGYKGVSWNKAGKKWVSKIYKDKKQITLGFFSSKREAYKVYCEAAKKYHGEFARLK